jgi:hypothetical protein
MLADKVRHGASFSPSDIGSIDPELISAAVVENDAIVLAGIPEPDRRGRRIARDALQVPEN